MTTDYTKLRVRSGRPYPPGTTFYKGEARFSIFSRHATRVWLALFENTQAKSPAWEFEFDPVLHKIGDMWTINVEGLQEGAYYLYRMDGPFAPERGHRFNPGIYLLDPYAKAFVGDVHEGTMKCVLLHDEMDWNHDPHHNRPVQESVIYECHVRGFTMNGNSGVRHRGTYAGLIEKIPYLKSLGVTTVELLPIQEFGENWLGRCSILTGQELTNYWGYSNVGFFAPTGRYAVSWQGREHVDEFRRMVLALHEAGLEVILDVVFNHTSEGNERGPVLCFRGIDNAIYYLLDKDGSYHNYSGCGNTVNCNHPLVRDFILDCLRYWAAVMHVDGFRFDLASILGRGRDGVLRADMPLVERIAEDPVLRDTKLIAEAWDAGGGYQVGSFGDNRWAEWNGRYRDDVRRYWRGDPGTRAAFASRLTGSSDIYAWAGRGPGHTINFITCHDGFTLRDLVSYEDKHNWANGEGNLDGSNDNYSANHGAEGETGDPAINTVRLRMQKNFIATLFLSLGAPMLLAGDEFGRTQRGNNNAYCQDNEISWLDWSLTEKNAALLAFTKSMIAFRNAHPVFRRAEYFQGYSSDGKHADVLWFDPAGHALDWGAPELPLGLWINPAENGGRGLYLAFNPSGTDIEFQLPPGHWCTCFYTGSEAPVDLHCEQCGGSVSGGRFTCMLRSMAVFCWGPRA